MESALATLIAVILVLTAGCSGSENAHIELGQSSKFQLSITGEPISSAAVGIAYSFQPTTNAPAGTRLKFTVSNKPGWANFDSETGALFGTPTAADIGEYGPIRVRVSDGASSQQLAPFNLSVTALPQVLVSISWLSPTSGSDTTNSPGDLAGYHIYYGQNENELTDVINISDPTVTNLLIENLSSGTWYFAVTTYNDKEVESKLSHIASIVI
jgi:hypothetical protein